MKGFILTKLGRAMLLSAAAVVSVSWLGCVADNGTGPSGGTAPRITTATLPSGTAGTLYSQTLKASGDAPITWSLESGALPAGLNLLGSGTISGTPTTAGAYSFSVKAINSAGSDAASFSVTIAAGSTIPTTPTSYSLDGVWETSGGQRVTISGSIGVLSSFGSSDLLLSAANKGYVQIGSQKWQDLTNTGNLTWSGQYLLITYNKSSPTVATGTSWANITCTMSADGNTLQTFISSNSVDVPNPSSTWTRVNYSLDGVWEDGGGQRITVSGSIGVISALGSSDLLLSAANKGYVQIGSQKWRNLTSTSNLTWSGQYLLITYNKSSPTVATGTSWANITYTMSADGNTLQTFISSSSVDVPNPSATWTRKQ